MVNFKPIPAKALVEAVSGTVLVNRLGERLEDEVTEIGEPLEVGPEGVAFIISEAFLKDVPSTQAKILVVQMAFAERVQQQLPTSVKLCVGCPDAYLGLAFVSGLIAKNDPLLDWQLPATAAIAIHPTAKVDSSARIGPGVVIGERAAVGPRTTIIANAVLGPETQVGADSMLFPGVVLYPRTQIGNRVRLHSNVVLGSDGFGYARGPQGSVKIWHLGRVRVGDDVEIGANTAVDRGTIKDTVIEKGVKIDNLVQIGHNGHVKSHAILCAQVGMAGNVTIGRGAILAGKVGVADKVEIGDGALVGPMSGLSKDIKPGEQVMGQQPARPRREWWRLIVLFEKLPELYERVKKLEGKSKNDA